MRADDVMQVLERHGRNGPVVAYVHNGPTASRDDGLVAALVARRARTNTPVVAVAPGGLDATLTGKYLAARIPLFRDIPSCFESLASYSATNGFWMAEERSGSAGNSIDKRLVAREGFLSELESSAVLRDAGLPMVQSTVVRSLSDVQRVCDAERGAFVMKALPVGVAHKNDAGLVLINIQSEEEAAESYRLLQERLKEGGFHSDSIMLMQPMVRAKIELIVGVSREPGLGHFLVVGLGGVNTEILNEVVLVPLAATPVRIRDVIAQSRLGRLLARIDRTFGAQVSLHHLLLRLQQFVANHGTVVDSIDLNPVLLTDEGCVAVDALICCR